MKRQVWLFIASFTALLLISGPVKADDKTVSEYLAEAWDRYYYEPYIDKLDHLRREEPQTEQEQAACDQFYSHVNQTGQMKIVMGIGYYDFSEGEPFKFDYRPDGQM